MSAKCYAPTSAKEGPDYIKMVPSASLTVLDLGLGNRLLGYRMFLAGGHLRSRMYWNR